MPRLLIGRGPIFPALCLLVIVASCLLMRTTGMWGSGASADTTISAPAVDFIAAAMKNQAATSIEVEYMLSDFLKFHYIRTPEALSMTLTSPDSGDVRRASYDFAARETRTLETKQDATTTGRVTTAWLGDPFTNGDVLDPVMFVLLWGNEGPQPLYERISSGQVLPQQEDVDGHQCWRVEVATDVGGILTVRSSVWVDPDVGFCPRRIQVNNIDAKREPTVISFRDYREPSRGVWFPMKQDYEFTEVRFASSGIKALSDPPEKPETPTILGRKTRTITASKVTAGGKFAKDSLLVKFPSGTKVYVNSSNTPEIVP